MKMGINKRAALFFLASIIVLGTMGCAKTDSNITKIDVHGMTIDVRELAEKLSFNAVNNAGDEWMREVFFPLLDKCDENGIYLKPLNVTRSIINGSQDMADCYNSKEYSNVTTENKEKYRPFYVELFPQMQEGALYGIEFSLQKEEYGYPDEKNNLDFKIAGMKNTDTSNDYEKNERFYQTLAGQLQSHFFDNDYNEIASGEYGKSYISIYLDRKCVDINDYREETKEIVNRYEEDDDVDILSENVIYLPNRGELEKNIATVVASFLSEQILTKAPWVEESTREKYLEFETAGLALLRSMQKIKNGSANELVVVVAEEEIGRMLKNSNHKPTEEEVAHEKENMGIHFFYITK